MISGVSMKSLRSSGFSKHLIQFMSNFCQGKINLTKEQFEEDYLSGLELEEISKKHGVNRSDITFLRQMYGIRRKGAKFIHRKRTEESITDRQREIIVGSLMGDAKKVSPSAVGFGQSEKQKDYLLWKYQELQNISSSNSLKPWSGYDSRSNKTHISWRFYTNANSDIEKIISLFYPGGDKQIRQEVLDMMSPLSIAVWYMDDGSTDHYHRKREVNPTYNISSQYSFCTDSFDLKSSFAIRDWFLNKWGIRVRLKKRGYSKNELNARWRIIIENESVNRFINLIEPYIIPSMRYKINIV